MLTKPVPSGVGRTAIIVSSIRSAEGRRPDSLVEDPFAYQVMAELADLPEEICRRRCATRLRWRSGLVAMTSRSFRCGRGTLTISSGSDAVRDPPGCEPRRRA
jgi:O-methyltransferase involved in polyketide biosynthesis